MEVNNNHRLIHKLVLTGGPCSGKTSGQNRLSQIFQREGWRVYRVPETATHLLNGGVDFMALDPESVEEFQENLLLCMMRTEETFFSLARRCEQNCLIICDRGVMDAKAYMTEESWSRMLKRNGLDDETLRDKRYDQVVHMITAANGAEQYYNRVDNPARMEEPYLARQRDEATGKAWIGHPNLTAIDNSTGFEEKLERLVATVRSKVDIELAKLRHYPVVIKNNNSYLL